MTSAAAPLAAEHEALWMLGYFYLRNAHPDKAATLFAALDRLQPDRPQWLRALALAQIRAGKPDRALAALDRLALAGAVDDAFHLLRAQALAALDRHAEAGAAMRAWLDARPAADPHRKDA